MRISECVVILPVIEQAIGAIDAAFERERQSREIAADFEREYERLAALPENISREVKSELPSVVQDEQKARVPMTRPRIENFYPWSYHATLAAQSLSKPDWAHAAEAIFAELRKLPKHPIDWTQPGVFDELREEVQEVGNRVRDILTSCVAEMKSQASKSEEGVELPFGYVPNVLPKVVESAKDSEKSSNAIEVPQGPSLREILTAGLSDIEMNMLAKLIELEQQYWEKPNNKSNPLWQKRYQDNRYQKQRAAKGKRDLALIARRIFEAEKDRMQNLNVQ